MGKNKKKLNNQSKTPKDSGNETTESQATESIDTKEVSETVSVEDKKEEGNSQKKVKKL